MLVKINEGKSYGGATKIYLQLLHLALYVDVEFICFSFLFLVIREVICEFWHGSFYN